MTGELRVLDTITVRHMPFEFPDEIDPVFIRGDHRSSFTFIAGSLLLPHLEPYLIRTMREARKHVTDPDILAGLDAFSAQEGHHARMHRKFNDAVQRAGFPGLAEMEQKLSDDYRRFSDTKSLRFNLAYAEGFEALTMNAVKLLMEPNGFGEDLPDYMQLVEWHFLEELEHRHVTFDVYDHVCAGYFYRSAVGAWAQWHFSSWIRRVAAYMLKRNPPSRRAAKEALKDGGVMQGPVQPPVLEMIKILFRIHSPSYSPHNVEIAPGIQALAHKYSAMATKIS
ncbi:MAG: metal-dependent hydrolase [Myxococcota bacterium]|nr:metal-dependent hydrolase [Myxococcota bacterium]